MWLAHFFHWFNFEYWQQSWPNIFAMSFWTMLGFIVSDVRHKHRIENLKDHHTGLVDTLAGQVDDLRGKLGDLIGVNDANNDGK